MNKFGNSSESNLIGVHPDMIRVARRGLQISPYDFGILRGVGTVAEQVVLVASKASQTMDSLHLPQYDGLSHAIDFGVYVKGVYINGDTPEEIGYYRKVNQAFITAAIELGIQIEAGALWRTFVDAGHVQLGKEYR